MRRKQAIRALAERFEIETPHVGHVASLALNLFDCFSPLNGLAQADRILLYAAGWLHDIGYAREPENHVEAGVRILQHNQLPAFSSADWDLLIAMVLLHRRNWRASLSSPLFPALSEREFARAKKLAAVLRVADGLDHGHIQDGQVLSCQRAKKNDKVRVLCHSYAGSIPWAQGKADLWEEVFGRPLKISGTVEASKDVFHGIVSDGNFAVPAARRIFYSQYDVMRDHVPGMIEGVDLECLHDYRVALRRFRAALRMFRPLLTEETSAAVLRKRLGDLSDQLGPPRDAHVLYQLFESFELPESVQQQLRDRVAQANRQIVEILQSEACLETVQQLNRFLRVELPALERKQKGPQYTDFSNARLAALMKRIVKQHPEELKADPVQLHELRKLCRRGRYYAEFAAPVLGKETRRLAKELRKVAAALGDVRDAQIHDETLQEMEGTEALRVWLQEQRQDAWSSFNKHWKLLIDY